MSGTKAFLDCSHFSLFYPVSFEANYPKSVSFMTVIAEYPLCLILTHNFIFFFFVFSSSVLLRRGNDRVCRHSANSQDQHTQLLIAEAGRDLWKFSVQHSGH